MAQYYYATRVQHSEMATMDSRQARRRVMPGLLQKEDLSLLVDGSYLYRWWLLSLPRAQRLYLHHYVGSDWSRDEHCHPKWFLSLGIVGWLR